VYQRCDPISYALSYEEYWKVPVSLAETDVIAIGEPLVRSMRSPRAPGGCGVTPLGLRRAPRPACVYWPGSGGRCRIHLDGAHILDSAPFRQAARFLKRAALRVRDSCHGGCAGRRRLQGALVEPDYYCPIVRGERPSLQVAGAIRDLPKLSSPALQS